VVPCRPLRHREGETIEDETAMTLDEMTVDVIRETTQETDVETTMIKEAAVDGTLTVVDRRHRLDVATDGPT
jgi:hypothetical protein